MENTGIFKVTELLCNYHIIYISASSAQTIECKKNVTVGAYDKRIIELEQEGCKIISKEYYSNKKF